MAFDLLEGILFLRRAKFSPDLSHRVQHFHAVQDAVLNSTEYKYELFL